MYRIGDPRRDEAVFRYAMSEKAYRKIQVNASSNGEIKVYMSGEYAGTVRIVDGQQTESSIHMDAGMYELKLVFEKAKRLEVYSIVLG